MKKVLINSKEYELIEDFNNGFDLTETEPKVTEYFDDFDYIFGDWAYGKLRLKGFYDSTNSKCRDLNDVRNKDKYLKENCAFGCRYFMLKKSV